MALCVHASRQNVPAAKRPSAGRITAEPAARGASIPVELKGNDEFTSGLQWQGRGAVGWVSLLAESSLSTWHSDLAPDLVSLRYEAFLGAVEIEVRVHRRLHGNTQNSRKDWSIYVR